MTQGQHLPNGSHPPNRVAWDHQHRYVTLSGYALGVYRILDNGKLRQLEQWPHSIKD